jgi:hypothetical protein
MSVVVWDGKTLAADRQVTTSGLGVMGTKMRKHGSIILAWTGDIDLGLALADWYCKGAILADRPKCQEDKDKWCRLIVADSTGCRYYETEMIPIPVMAPFAAWGSGRDFAYGALEMGADAQRAVTVASIHSIDCGFGVESYIVEGL